MFIEMVASSTTEWAIWILQGIVVYLVGLVMSYKYCDRWSKNYTQKHLGIRIGLGDLNDSTIHSILYGGRNGQEESQG